MMQLDRITLGRKAKELGFVRDTLEKVCRLTDILKFFETDELLCHENLSLHPMALWKCRNDQMI